MWQKYFNEKNYFSKQMQIEPISTNSLLLFPTLHYNTVMHTPMATVKLHACYHTPRHSMSRFNLQYYGSKLSVSSDGGRYPEHQTNIENCNFQQQLSFGRISRPSISSQRTLTECSILPQPSKLLTVSCSLKKMYWIPASTNEYQFEQFSPGCLRFQKDRLITLFQQNMYHLCPLF